MAGRRGSNISIADRGRWLVENEAGKSVSDIGKSERRSTRKVIEHLAKARLERELQAARHEQLREVLRTHQSDLLAMIEHIHRAIRVGPIASVTDLFIGSNIGERENPPGIAEGQSIKFGPNIAPPTSTEDGSRFERIGLNFSGSAFFLTNTPLDGYVVRIQAETSVLWQLLHEHMKRNDIWKLLASWEAAVFSELDARWGLNAIIRARAETLLGLGASEPSQAQLTPPFVPSIRTEVLQESEHSLFDDMYWDTGSLRKRDGTSLVEGVQAENQAEIDVSLRTLVDEMGEPQTIEETILCRERAAELTETVLKKLEGALLLNFVPGECSVCQSLSAP